MDAASNGSPQGLSNIQSIDAKEGWDPAEKSYIPTEPITVPLSWEDDIKVTSRFNP